MVISKTPPILKTPIGWIAFHQPAVRLWFTIALFLPAIIVIIMSAIWGAHEVGRANGGMWFLAAMMLGFVSFIVHELLHACAMPRDNEKAFTAFGISKLPTGPFTARIFPVPWVVYTGEVTVTRFVCSRCLPFIALGLGGAIACAFSSGLWRAGFAGVSGFNIFLSRNDLVSSFWALNKKAEKVLDREYGFDYEIKEKIGAKSPGEDS